MINKPFSQVDLCTCLAVFSIVSTKLSSCQKDGLMEHHQWKPFSSSPWGGAALVRPQFPSSDLEAKCHLRFGDKLLQILYLIIKHDQARHYLISNCSLHFCSDSRSLKDAKEVLYSKCFYNLHDIFLAQRHPKCLP